MNCGPELSYILAEFFNMFLKESCFPDCWKVSSVVPVFKNVGERPTAKNYHTVSLLSMVSKVSEKLVNNRIVDHQEKCGLFSDTSKIFNKAWHAGLLHKLIKVAATDMRYFTRSKRSGSLVHKRNFNLI